MLDVHAPEHRIGGARDFFLHIFTITVGLLIALGLENAVEALHHRHLRREAEANIRQELRQNLDMLIQRAPQVNTEGKQMLLLLSTLEDHSAGKPMPPAGNMKVGFGETPIPDAAWRTASTTGVLNYMDYNEVQAFADAYKQQDMLQAEEESALNDYLEFIPILQIHAKDLTPEQAKEALPLVRHAIAHINGMLALGEGTVGSYKEALK